MAGSVKALTKEWRLAMKAAGLMATLHSLRHTHASTLIASGLDVFDDKPAPRLASDHPLGLRTPFPNRRSRGDSGGDVCLDWRERTMTERVEYGCVVKQHVSGEPFLVFELLRGNAPGRSEASWCRST